MATTTKISLEVRQEVLAVPEAYVAVSSITGVNELTGTAALEASAPFVITRQTSGAELFKSIIHASDLSTTPLNYLTRLVFKWGTYNPNNLTSVTYGKATYPDYWKTAHSGVLEASGNDGSLGFFGTENIFTDTVFGNFSANDVGKKIEITNGTSPGMYEIAQWLSPSTVQISSPVGLPAESGLEWNLYSFGPATTSSVASDSSGHYVSSFGVLPAQVPDVENDFITINLYDSSDNLVQGNILATPTRTNPDLSEFRDSSIYTYHGSADAARAQNNLVSTYLKTYVDELNTAGGLLGSHSVSTITVS